MSKFRNSNVLVPLKFLSGERLHSVIFLRLKGIIIIFYAPFYRRFMSRIFSSFRSASLVNKSCIVALLALPSSLRSFSISSSKGVTWF